VGLPEAIHYIDVVQRAHHVLENAGALFVDLSRGQPRQVIEEALAGPLFVIGKQAGSAYVDHQTSPMAMSASFKDSAIPTPRCCG
jgi:hypothetical protein